ncbi:MAG: FAD-dependent thymidylate synthase [Clostridia bacterium]|nr:FAD-dependent thymidylate synthase [Clostridia bacterium]
MNNSKVKLVGISDLGEKISAAAGRISTREGKCSDMLLLSNDDEKNIKFISRVTDSGHNSVVEHTCFNFVFEDVSAFFEQFLIEFRLMSFTVKSRRYVDFNEAGFYVPNGMDKSDKAKYIEHMKSLFKAYGELLNLDILKEDARFILPYCLHSNIFCTVNGRELLHLLFAMIYGRKSHIDEIKTLGLSMLEQLRKKAPGIANNFEKRAELKLKSQSKNTKINISKNLDKKLPLVNLISFPNLSEQILLHSTLVFNGDYSNEQLDSLIQDKTFMTKYIKDLINSERPRELENLNYTFQFNDVSLPCLTHFSRHRIWSINIPPLENVNRNEFKIPPSILKNKKALEIVEQKLAENIELYNLFAQKYSSSITCYILLSGNTLSFTGTINARELILFMKLRTCNRAQWEIQDYANEMLNLIREKSPEIFNHYGPSCFVLGYCPEGKLTCGNIKSVIEKYRVQ